MSCIHHHVPNGAFILNFGMCGVIADVITHIIQISVETFISLVEIDLLFFYIYHLLRYSY